MQAEQKATDGLVVKAREKYLKLQTELTREKFKLQDLLYNSNSGFNPSAIGDCYGRIAAIQCQMLEVVVNMQKQQTADPEESTPVPCKVKFPPIQRMPNEHGVSVNSMGWVCQYVGDTSSRINWVCTNVNSGSWSIQWKDGESTDFAPGLVPLV